MKALCILLVLSLTIASVFAETVIEQGNLATIILPPSCTSISSESGSSLPVIFYASSTIALVPIDIRHATGTFVMQACDRTIAVKVVERNKETRTFPIPESQGGNTAYNAKKLPPNSPRIYMR